MLKLPKELLKDYVREQNFSTTEEVLAAMKEMFKDVVQEVLEAEMDDYLGYDKYEVSEKKVTNSRNGYSKKTIKSELGEVEIAVPRDRTGEFEAKIVSKYQRNVTRIEDKILSLYSKGMTTRDISDQIKELYDVEISAEMVSNITNKILPLVTEWQTRQLEKEYSFVFMVEQMKVVSFGLVY